VQLSSKKPDLPVLFLIPILCNVQIGYSWLTLVNWGWSIKMKMRYSVLLINLLLSCVMSLLGCESVQQSAVDSEKHLQKKLAQITLIKSPNDDRQYAAILLSNQLQVVLVSDPSLENSAASLAVGVGSAQDPATQMGLAHYLEHMLFLGTEKYPEPDGFMKYTQANGGMTNAFTAFDKTNYLFQINATKFDEALDRFSDYFKKPTFDPHHSNQERQAVNSEWSLQKAQDGWNLQELMGITANPQNPQAKFNIGNLDTLKDQPDSVLQDELVKFYQRYYSANIMKLTLVGKQSLTELQALAEKHFLTIPNNNVTLPVVTTTGLTQAQMAKKIKYKPIKELKELYVDFPIASNKDQWRLKPNEYVRNLLSSEEPGTLAQQLRAMGLVKVLSADVAENYYGPDGFFRIRAELTDAGLGRQDEVIAAIFSYVDLIKRDGIKAEYYRELQAMSEKDFLNISKREPLSQAVELTMTQFDYPLENLLNCDYIYEKYKPAVIKNLVQQLDKRKARIWFVNPKVDADILIPYFDGKYKVEDIKEEDFKRWQALTANYRFTLPPLNDLFSDKSAPLVTMQYTKPHQVVSELGVEAFLIHPEFYREDKGVLSFQINVHFSEDSAENIVLANLLSEVYEKKNLTLMDRAARASIGVDMSLTPISAQRVKIQGYTTKHAQLLKQLLNSYATMTIDEQEFADALDSYQDNLNNKNKIQVYQQTFAHAKRLSTKALWIDQELLAASKKVTLEKLIHFYERVKREHLVRIFATGNYSPEQVKEMAFIAKEMLPSDIAADQRAVTQYRVPKYAQTIRVKNDVNLADSAVLQAWFGEQPSDDVKAQLSVLNALFSRAFFQQLRTNEQLGYVVTSFDYAIDEVPGFIMVVQSSNSNLTKIYDRMSQFRKSYINELKKIDVNEIEQAKRALIANITEKPANFYEEMERYTAEFWEGKYQFDARERRLSALEKVTKEDVIKTYQNLILDKKSGQFFIQMRGTNFKNQVFVKE
jgi:protease III